MRGYASSRAPQPALDALAMVRKLVACWPDTVPGEPDHWIADVSSPVLRHVQFPSPWHDAYVPRDLPHLNQVALNKQIESLRARR